MDNWPAQWRVNVCLLFLQLTAACSLREEVQGAVTRNWKHCNLDSLKWPHIYLDTTFCWIHTYLITWIKIWEERPEVVQYHCSFSSFHVCSFVSSFLSVCFRGWGLLGFFLVFFGKTMSTLSIHFFILLKLANEQFEKNSVVMVVLVFIYYKTWLRKI